MVGEMNKKIEIMFWAVILVLILLPVASYIHVFGFGFWTTSTEWAELGGFFGGVLGPILSFVSILILWLSLKQSTTDSQNQVNALEKQVQYIALTSFDSTFYSALKLISEQSQKKSNVKTSGFEAYNEELSQILSSVNIKEANTNSVNLWRDANCYFETVFQVVELVERSEVAFNLGFKYRELLLSQLTEAERFWSITIVENCLDEPRKKVLLHWLK
ncbi:hypothetical protein ACS82_00760 [Vibrio parahaemolyticus]|nr:hypothetical protein ACS82_00760 [Vibrio parahaemolyticus]